MLPPGNARDVVRRTLDRAGCESLPVTGPEHLIGADVDVVVLDWSALGADPAGAYALLAKQVPKTPFIAVVDRTPFSEMSSIFAAGVSDLVRAPVQPDELNARIGKACARAHRAPRPAAALMGLDRLGQGLADDLSSFVGQAIEPTDPNDEHDPADRVAVRLLLHSPKTATELSVFVVTEQETLQGLAQTMLGLDARSDSSDVTDDLARELANLAAGAVKRICSPEGVNFTMGLPSRVCTEEVPGSEAAWKLRLRGGGAAVAFDVIVDAKACAPAVVKVAELREGQVVAHDVKTPGGTMLLTAGSRLTVSLVGRLRSLLPDNLLLSVLDPGDARPKEFQ